MAIPGLPIHAFDTYVAHPALSRSVVEAYNRFHPDDIVNSQELEWLVQGSISEDLPALRSLNHFYDPQSAAGLSVAGVQIGLGSPDWATNSEAQSRLSASGDCSWRRAIEEYRRAKSIGEEGVAHAFICLGQVLHLLEDVAVPAHSRNDQHLDGDSFEQWVKFHHPVPQLPPNGIGVTCKSPHECIKELALWVNEHFVSIDTMKPNRGILPMARAQLDDRYAVFEGRRIAAYNAKNGRYFLSEEIQSLYWQEISPRMVAYGQRLLEIFFEEVEGNEIDSTSSPKNNKEHAYQSNAISDFIARDNFHHSEQLSSSSELDSEINENNKKSREVEVPGMNKMLFNLVSTANSLMATSLQSSSGGGNSTAEKSQKLPDTFITTRPASRTNERRVVFHLASDSGADFECRLDDEVWHACNNEFELLIDAGAHELMARAFNRYGIDPSPAQYQWSVDLTPPLTFLSSHASSHSRSAAFNFYSEEGTVFRCRLDDDEWQECQSPIEYDDLLNGQHVFRVKAIDEVGNEELLPSAHQWIIDLPAPAAPVIEFPASPLYYTNHASIDFLGAIAPGTLLKINGLLADIRDDSHVFISNQELKEGNNLFTFQSFDDSGQASAPIERHIVRDNEAPRALIFDLAEHYDETGFKLLWRGSDNNGVAAYDLQYKKNEGDWLNWAIAINSTEKIFAETLHPGDHIGFRVRASDQAGNYGAWSEEVSTTVGATPAPITIHSGLVALWHFDECRAETKESISGQEYYQPADVIVGPYGCAISEVSGAQRALRWPLPMPLASRELTVSFQVRNARGLTGSLWLLDDQGNYQAGVSPDEGVSRVIRNGGPFLIDAGVRGADQWQHLTIVYSPEYFAWYLDGVLIKKLWGDYGIEAAVSTLYIGQDNAPWQLDEIAVWSRALSDDEVADLTGEQLTPRVIRPLAPKPQLIHYWSFDEESGEAYDSLSTARIPNAFRLPGHSGQAIELYWKPQFQVNIPVPAIFASDLSLGFWRKNGPNGGGGAGNISLWNAASGSSFGVGGGYGSSFLFHNHAALPFDSFLPQDNNWHHIMVVYDSYAYKLQYYVDGHQKISQSAIWLRPPFDSLMMNESQGSVVIDDLKVWNGALSSADVAKEANLEP